MKKTSSLLIVLLISAVLISACTPVAQAENENEAMMDNDDSSIELEGLVESMDGDTWTVAGKTVFVNPAVLGSVSFMNGDTVRIEGALNDDASVTAIKVELLQSANANSNDDNSNSSNSNTNTNTNTNSNTNSNSNDDYDD
jgi:hypothetical protein